MAEGALIDRLDQTIDLVVARGDATSALADPELAALAVLAVELRHYPAPEFKARVRATLERRTTMSRALVATNIREGFTTVTPYVRVRDKGLFDFLVQVFEAEETGINRGPAGGLHREVRLGNSMLMIGEGGQESVTHVRPAAFHVYVKDADATFARALAAGGESMGEPEDRPYGERAGFVKDPFGNHWYIATAFGASYVPKGLRDVTPFIYPKGASDYIEFLKRAFGAVEEFRAEAPSGVIRHAQLRIGNAAIQMGEGEGAGAPTPMPSGFYLYVGDADAVYQQAIAAGAKPLMPPADRTYGDRMGAVEDPMGNVWAIARPV